MHAATRRGAAAAIRTMARSEHTASSLGALAPDPEQYAYAIPELAQTRAYASVPDPRAIAGSRRCLSRG